jgi:hypothetical protein
MADPIERFLHTGEFDPQFRDWEGTAAERRRQGMATLRDVLVRVTRWRADRAPLSLGRVPPDADARIQERLRPMLEGLFDPAESARLLDELPRHVVVLTPSTFAVEVARLPLGTAWDLANVLLDQVGAPPLGDDAPTLDGLCDETGRAWILPAALRSEEAFPDVVVHEGAHLLHTPSAGGPLRLTPRRRETFAYACEIWSGVLRGADVTAALAAITDARVQRKVLERLLSDAAQRGWTAIRDWAR